MGNGQEFGGSNDYGQVPYHSSLDITDAVTVAAWVKPASEHNGGILEKTVGGTVNTQYLFFLNSGSGTRFRVHRGSTNYTATSDSYPSTTGWTYVVGRYDGSEVSVWVNGEKQPTTAAVASPIASGNGVTLIGHLGSSVYPFSGCLDEVRISDTARSPAWVKASYRSQKNILLVSVGTSGGIKGGDNTLLSEDGNGVDSHVYETDADVDTAYWNNGAGNGLWSDPDNDPDDPYSLDPWDTTGVLEVADGESAGAHSAYEGRCASYTEPDPPDLTPAGDPYAGPPADPPAVPPVADITEPFSGYKTVLQLCL